MKSKTSAQAPSAPAQSIPGLSGTGLDTLFRQQLVAMNQFSCALLEGSQVLRKIQLDAAHEAQLRHEACREKLHACTSVAEAMEASRAAGNADVEAASRYWTDLTQACSATAARLAGQAVGELQAEAPVPDLQCFRPAPFAGPFALPLARWNPLATWRAVIPPPLPD